MKKVFALALALLVILSLTACGGKNPKKDIVGVWHAVDEETETDYGLGIEFTKDGKLRYGLTEDVLASLSDGDSKDAKDAMAGLDMLMSIEYKIKSDTEMEVTVSAMFGLAKESDIIPYSLDGDTLTFDGATYTRMK
ncbi:hypothetical protein [Diplocloster modestus]|uniref:Uncharacterized protein n=1 Tax=Diplocloster modestus TaxID=2850322 RepID=A0ABS6KD92_9FIRM|nr:hypothetical protein [Diplocloster modestus]MBU9728458.1 hypothetical protein [Diplocloster modestus]